MFLAAGAAAPDAFLTLYPGLIHPLDLSLSRHSDDFLAQGPPLFTLGNAYLLLANHARAHTPVCNRHCACAAVCLRSVNATARACFLLCSCWWTAARTG